MEKFEAVSLIQKFVSESSPSPIRGAKLAEALKRARQDFSAEVFGCRNLRQFISKYVPEIVEEGKAGTDILYRRRDQQQPLFDQRNTLRPTVENRPAPLRQLLDHPRVWKTFASPDSIYGLYIAPGSDQVRVLHPKDHPDPGWREIKPIAAETLKDIAKDFIQTLPDEGDRTSLLHTLDEPKWWLPYFDVLQNLGLKSRWIVYRRRRIAEAFELAVLNSSASEGHAPQQTAVHQSDVKDVSPNELAGDLMRRVASAVILRLTEPELRSLNLPLGYIMDAIQK